MGEKEHYVHFSSTSGSGCNSIVVQPLRHGHLNVNLGFLQIYHRYHVQFTVPWNTCVVHPEGKPLSPPALPAGEQSSNCRVIGITQEKDDLRLTIELLVSTERYLKEELRITCCDQGAPLTIYLNARIFGKDQGTPVLRKGIRSLGVEHDHLRDEDSREEPEEDEEGEDEEDEEAEEDAAPERSGV